QSEDKPEHDRNSDRNDANPQRNAAAVQDPGENVASKLIGPEQVLPIRRLVQARTVDNDRIVRRKPRGTPRASDNQKQNEAAKQRRAVAAQAPPGVTRVGPDPQLRAGRRDLLARRHRRASGRGRTDAHVAAHSLTASASEGPAQSN